MWFIDVIGDKTQDRQARASCCRRSCGTSTSIFTQASTDIAAGTFGTTNYTLDLDNGGISLLQTEQIDDEAWPRWRQAQAGIADGDHGPETTKTDEVEVAIGG